MKSLRVLFLLAVTMALAVVALGQEGYPLSGTWYGEYSAGAQRRDMTVILKWDGKTASGVINPGPDAIPIASVTMDITPGKPAPEGRGSTEGTPPIYRVRFQANLPGGATTFEGTLQNPVAGNRRLMGTWTRGADKGTFQLRRL